MSDYGYGLWGFVVIDSAVFILFAFSFFKPRGGRDWRALGGFSAFIVALFSEMYGYPLTIYLLSGVLGSKLGLGHGSGHLWNDLIGWQGDPHLSPLHIASYVLIIAGLWLIAAAWRVLLAAQKAGELASGGPYARVRHPQYSGLLLIMLGFLTQWPTIPTLAMFPVLLVMYRQLATREEQEVAAAFPGEWDAYAAQTPRFIPRRLQIEPVVPTDPIRAPATEGARPQRP
jgi:protein-S-isoprenylcysteine O-methyltransferase Ste14